MCSGVFGNAGSEAMVPAPVSRSHTAEHSFQAAPGQLQSFVLHIRLSLMPVVADALPYCSLLTEVWTALCCRAALRP